ncbi:MAG: hypothetical protein QXQ40_00370, partial [Candidatus Aenigmatarchaeota archaeon]
MKINTITLVFFVTCINIAFGIVIEPQCYDTDGGYNPCVRGTATGYMGDPRYGSWTDYCVGSTVYEYMCRNGYVVLSPKDCWEVGHVGCKDGACLCYPSPTTTTISTTTTTTTIPTTTTTLPQYCTIQVTVYDDSTSNPLQGATVTLDGGN